MERVLVTGASSWIGGRAVQVLEARPGTRVLAVDDVDPRLSFQSEFAVISLDRLEFAELLVEFAPTAVLHLGTFDRSATVGAERSDRGLVIGAQALFGAIARCNATKAVVVKSAGTVYGTGPRQPSVAMEETPLHGRGSDRHQRLLRDLEQFVASQAERHRGASYTVLRFAPIVGPNVGNDISRYLALGVVPSRLGFDPRLQFIGEEDALGALIHALDVRRPGTFNVAAPGQLYLSRVLRLGRRVQQPLPNRALRASRRGLAALGVHLTNDDVGMLTYGRVMDTTAASRELGYEPRLNCRQAVLALYQRLPETQPRG